MRLKFKEQQFQLDAVKSVVDCFTGQEKETSRFNLDRGRSQKEIVGQVSAFDEEIGFKNKNIQIDSIDILKNIKEVQKRNGLIPSRTLKGKYNLTIEMETGTGKTYTYIRTMYELYKHYGWSKYIIVVPSIAIREGVYKSFQITEDHFMSIYGSKIRYFIYNSKHLNKLDAFASDGGINVMIINSQAFNARGKDARRIYMELDEFQSRRPIDVIAKTNPIMIIDEPQSVEGSKTKESLKAFNPLFTLRYSATHREEYNKIYRLDALDAYNEKLVKKIQVKGISMKGTTGTNEYLYLEDINLSKKGYPLAKLEYEVRKGKGLKRVSKYVDVGFNLYEHSGLEQYKGYTVSEINGYHNTLSFTNGVVLYAGDVQGDVSEEHMRRIQIRETIKSHFEKERELFHTGVKVLSLFFIDEVAKYRQYDKEGNAVNGPYGRIFEEEYMNILNDYITLMDDPYVDYLKTISVAQTHEGYFSIDKYNRMVDPKVKGKEKITEDESAFDKIMRNKERLLSFEEPIRFIFSHSALREGWDNPNVFQICTLKHSESMIGKRQEVGRGLRLCVDRTGNRMDSETLGTDVHGINALTIVASESYESFAKALQSEIASALSDRPKKASVDFFQDKIIKDGKGNEKIIDDEMARLLQFSLKQQGFIDIRTDELTDKYFDALEKDEINVPDDFKGFEEGIIQLISNIYTEGKTNLIEDARSTNIKNIAINENFHREEFKRLWKKINVKTAYKVDFDTHELIQNAIHALDSDLRISDLSYEVRRGEMTQIDSKEDLEQGKAFNVQESFVDKVKVIDTSHIRFDLVGKLVDETNLTRKAIVDILKGVKPRTFFLFQKNPEEFILKASRIINEQKASMIIEHITYDRIDDVFDVDIFTKNKLNGILGKDMIETQKHVYDYLKYDSGKEKSFAEEMEIRPEVKVYAKLPRDFYIPTPVGRYNPDWAIVFDEGTVRHIYFVAETKGKLESLDLDIRGRESAKIHCATEHFNKISDGSVKYYAVDSYEMLMEKILSSK